MTMDASPSVRCETAASGFRGKRRLTRIAAFASTGTSKLGRLLGFPVAVVAAADDPRRQADRLSAEWYGAGTSSAEWVVPIDMLDWDFKDYRHVPFDPRWLGGRSLPWGLSIVGGALVADLPPGVTQARFAAAFQDRLAALRYDEVARRPSHVTFRRRSNRPLDARPRYGCANGDVTSPYPVRGLVAFRPRQLPDIASLAAATLLELASAAAVRDPPCRRRARA